MLDIDTPPGEARYLQHQDRLRIQRERFQRDVIGPTVPSRPAPGSAYRRPGAGANSSSSQHQQQHHRGGDNEQQQQRPTSRAQTASSSSSSSSPTASTATATAGEEGETKGLAVLDITELKRRTAEKVKFEKQQQEYQKKQAQDKEKKKKNSLMARGNTVIKEVTIPAFGSMALRELASRSVPCSVCVCAL